MIIAHHLILTGYGHWLPNGPRGSMSQEIAAGKLFPIGDIHCGRKADQPPRDAQRAAHTRARPLLEHEVFWFDVAARRAIAEAFSSAVSERRYTCYACAILSNHAHLVIRKHRDRAEQMIRALKSASALRIRGIARLAADHPVWSTRPFKRFIDNADAMQNCIRYVEQNPIKSGELPQKYDFVTTWRVGWFEGSRSRENTLKKNMPRRAE